MTVPELMSCVGSALSSPVFWILLLGSVTGKHRFLKPWLERHYKTTYISRQRLRQRRLKDTLEDPLLVMDMERRFTRKFDGDRHRALEAIEQLRQKAHAGLSEEPENRSKGDEKKEAANAILYGTLFAALACHSLLSTSAESLSMQLIEVPLPAIGTASESRFVPSVANSMAVDEEGHRRLSASPFLDAHVDCNSGTLFIQHVVFFLVHLMDSALMWHSVHRKPKLRFESGLVNASSGDLEQLLLNEEH